MVRCHDTFDLPLCPRPLLVSVVLRLRGFDEQRALGVSNPKKERAEAHQEDISVPLFTRNVGFLRYFTVQQAPNFILASPILLVSFGASIHYYHARWPAWLTESLPWQADKKQADQRKTASSSSSKSTLSSSPSFLHPDFLPFVHLHTILTLILFLASHVQIALRQASTNPVIFWYLAHLILNQSTAGRFWVYYVVVWGAVSTALWTSFYPPA